MSRNFKVRTYAVLAIWLVSLAAPVSARAQTGAATATPSRRPAIAVATPAAGRCAGLTAAGRRLGPGVVITSAQLRSANAPTPLPPGSPAAASPAPAMPEHCEVLGKANERTGADGQRYAIGFRIRLPTRWNGRFLFQGGGGSDGEVRDATGVVTAGAPTALDRGFAVVATDAGHDNRRNNDPARQGQVTFGFDYQARVDYGDRSLEVVARLGKRLVTAFYGRAPRRSYFLGCSNGGRQGMVFAQRFPDLFDGIATTAPGFALPKAAIAEAWDTQAFAGLARRMGLVDSAGTPQINRTFSDGDLALVAQATLEACDAADGAGDGMIGDFASCTTARVTPALAKRTCAGAKADGCLSTDQVATLNRVFAGPTNARGEALYSDWPWDAGVADAGWRMWKIGSYDGRGMSSALNVILGSPTLSAVFTTPPTPVPDDPRAHLEYQLGFSMDTDAPKIFATSPAFPRSSWDVIAAKSTDLSRFRRRGGKLIVTHGVSDPIFSVNDTRRWWEAVNAADGGRAARCAPFRRPRNDALRRRPGDRPLRQPRGGRRLGRARGRARPHRGDGRPEDAVAGPHAPALPAPAGRAVHGRGEHRAGAELRLPLTMPWEDYTFVYRIERTDMKLLVATALSLSLLAPAFAQTSQPAATPNSAVQNSEPVKIIRSGSQPSGKGPEQYFTGNVRVDPLIQPMAPSRLSGGSVTFEPGARTAWHTHPLGQTLIVTAGVGRVQSWGGPVEEIRTGDVARIPPNVKHWHGASPTVAMTHIAILEQLDGKSVEWMEKVSDEQYRVAPGAPPPPGPAPARQPAPTTTQQPAQNINMVELRRVPENAPPPKTPPRGPYAVEVFTDPGLPTHTIYQPQAPANARRKMPVVAWGNGGCANDNRTARDFLTTVASHGFFIIAPSPKEPAERGTTRGSVMADALKWAEAENGRDGSPLRGRLDLDRVGVMGYSCGGLQAIENSADPRVKSVMLFASGTFERANQMSSASKESLKTLHSPIAYFIGGPTDVAYANAEDDFKRIEGVPVLKANINTGHMGTFAHPGGGWFAEAASAWLKWTLDGDEAAGSYFKGKNCKLCLDPVWSIERKNLGS